MNDKEIAEDIFNTIETFEELSTLSLRQLFAFQRMIGYAIEEKIQEQEGVLTTRS